MLEKIVGKLVKNAGMTRRKFLNLGLAALLTISGIAYNPVKAAGDNTIHPYAPIEEGSNIEVYSGVTPEEIAEWLIVPGTEEDIGKYISYLYDTNIQRIEFGQTKEQYKEIALIAYELAAKNVDEGGFSVAYPLNKEQLDETVEKIGDFPIMLQEYVGKPKKEQKGKIYLTPMENLPGRRNIAYISTGIITEPNTKTKEDPYCDYEILLESTINPKTGEIKETQILPKEKTTYNTPYNKEGIKDLERYGYDTIFVDSTTRIYYGDGYNYPSETKSYIVGCIIKEKKEKDVDTSYKIYFSPPSIWHIHIKSN